MAVDIPVSASVVLTWNDCVKEAARNHPDLIAAQQGVVQQEASVSLAGSSRWPQFSAALGASNTWSSKSGSGNSFSYGIAGSQLLFDGFKTANIVSAARQDVIAAKAGYRFTSAALRLRLRQAFINVLKAQKLAGLTQEIQKLRSNSLSLITLRYQSGMEHKGALLAAKANLAQADFDIDRARRGLESAQTALGKELGRDRFSPLRVKGSFEIAFASLTKPDMENIAGSDPSLQKIRSQKRSAGFSLKAEQGDFWPQLSLTGDVSRSDTHWMPEDQGSSAGLRVSWPVFEGGSRAATLTRSRSVYRQLEEQERSTGASVRLDLEQSWNAFVDAAGYVTVQQQYLLAAEERAKIAEQQYSVGLSTYNDWTIIEDGLVSSKKSFLDTQANAVLMQAAWIAATGETLEYEK